MRQDTVVVGRAAFASSRARGADRGSRDTARLEDGKPGDPDSVLADAGIVEHGDKRVGGERRFGSPTMERAVRADGEDTPGILGHDHPH